MTAGAIIALVSAIASFLVELAKAYSNWQSSQATKAVDENVQLKDQTAKDAIAEKVGNDVSGMSDSAVADQLRKYTRD